MPAAISRAIFISTVIGNLSRLLCNKEYKEPFGQYSVTRLEIFVRAKKKTGRNDTQT